MKILSYNVHKGFDLLNTREIMSQIKSEISRIHPDIVLFQEILGRKDKALDDLQCHLELMGNDLWPYHAYGCNVSKPGLQYGNAILSRLPIRQWENIDISTNPRERRGLLHVEFASEEGSRPLHVFNVHLDLFEKGRRKQLSKIIRRAQEDVPSESGLIIAGDFNDWRRRASNDLCQALQVEEAHRALKGDYARTFPSMAPALALDRIYFRDLDLRQIERLQGRPWSQLSDHLALMAEFAEAPSKLQDRSNQKAS